jgi:hypothetical protein
MSNSTGSGLWDRAGLLAWPLNEGRTVINKHREHFRRIIVLTPANGSSGFPQSPKHKYDWRTFVLEFLHGSLTIAWYVVALVEMSMLIGLTRFGKFVAASSDDLSRDEGGHNVLPDPASSSEDR